MKGIHAGAAPNAAASQHANPSSTFLLLPQQLLDLRKQDVAEPVGRMQQHFL